jgi:hypothetical protein
MPTNKVELRKPVFVEKDYTGTIDAKNFLEQIREETRFRADPVDLCKDGHAFQWDGSRQYNVCSRCMAKGNDCPPGSQGGLQKGRPKDWPLARWFPPETAHPGVLKACPCCGMNGPGFFACTPCWNVHRGQAYTLAIESAYETNANDPRVICEVRAWFAEKAPSPLARTKWIDTPIEPASYPATDTIDAPFDEEDDRGPPYTLHASFEALAFALFRTSSIKRLVLKVAEGRDSLPFFEKAFSRGREDWARGEPKTPEGLAYERSLDRAEQVFEILTA